MQVIQPASPRPSVGVVSHAAIMASLGLALVASGLWLGYQELTSSALAELILRARPDGVGTALAALGWAFGILAPAALVLAGAVRLGRAVSPAIDRRPNPYLAIARRLPDGHTAALGVRLPDGRYVPALVVGPYGIAVLERMPPPEALRRIDGRWEARLRGRGWTTIEDPLLRAERDADAVRRWLGDDDVDFVVSVHAAVVDDRLSVARTPRCAVVAAHEVPEFLEALPVQRQLTPQRREQVLRRIEAAIA